MSTQETAASRTALNHPADQPRVAIVTGGSRGIGRETVAGWPPTDSPPWSATRNAPVVGTT